MAVESPQPGAKKPMDQAGTDCEPGAAASLDAMVEALRAELGELNIDAPALAAEERLRSLSGLDAFWDRAWEQYADEDLPLDRWRSILGARWSRPWAIEGEYRCLRFGWQGRHAMRLALGVVECRRRMLRDIEREQWRRDPDKRCARTAEMAAMLRARDLLRLRKLYDVAVTDLDKSRNLQNRLRDDIAANPRFRSTLGLSRRTTAEIIGPQAGINRFGLAVVECRRRLCDDIDRATRPPDRPVGGNKPRDDDKDAPPGDGQTNRRSDNGRGSGASATPSILPTPALQDATQELQTAIMSLFGEAGTPDGLPSETGRDAPLASAPFRAPTDDEPPAAAPRHAADAPTPAAEPESDGEPESADETASDAGTASNDAPPAPPHRSAALTTEEQTRLNARFMALDEPTRVQIADEGVCRGVLPLTPIDQDGEATETDLGEGAGAGTIDWANTDRTVLAHFLRDAFARQGISWRDPP